MQNNSLKSTNCVDEKVEILNEAMLSYLYINPKTKTVAEFTLDGVEQRMGVDEAIALFIQRLKHFSKVDGALPDALVKLLTLKEIGFFLMAPYDEQMLQTLKEMIYIQREEQFYYDRYGFEYRVEWVGIKDAVLTYEQPDGSFITLQIASAQLDRPGEVLQAKDLGSF